METTTPTTIDNGQDVIDSREIIARIEELETDEDCAREQLIEDAEGSYSRLRDLAEARRMCWRHDGKPFYALDDEEADELYNLKELEDQASGYSGDWLYGSTLIRDSYFVEYAQQTAEDIGAISPDAAWPANRIDWEAAAEDLQMDYTCVDFDGVDYWIR